MDMENNLFRKRSLESISSPDELHDYMRVTSPRLWMLLAAVILLLTGFIVYASTATMENTITIQVEVQSYENDVEGRKQGGNARYSVVSCSLPASMMETVKTGCTVRLGKEKGIVSWISTMADDDRISVFIQMEHEYVPLPDGTYEAELVLESTTPISFLWN